jgi:purine-nucleoside phosphorylase
VAADYDYIAAAARLLREQGAEVPVALLAGPIFREYRSGYGLPIHPAPFVYGRMAGRTVAIVGDDAVLSVRVAGALGTRMLVVGAAARGVHPRLRPGHLLVWTDHINATGTNPLTALDDPRLGPCFLDLGAPYDAALQAAAEAAATAKGLTAHRGVYLDAPGCLPGTNDDLRAMRMLGADAAGNGGVAEVIVGVQAGLKVLGLALVLEDPASTEAAATCLPSLVTVAERCIGLLEPCA